MEMATANSHRTALLLSEAGISPPQRIPTLAELPVPDLLLFDPENSREVRSLLVQQRISQPDYRPPESRLLHRVSESPLLHRFKSKKGREAKSNENNLVFSKHEVAKAFNSLLSTVPLPPLGIAHALLSRAPLTSLEELWAHLHDPKLEKRSSRRFGRKSSSVGVPEITWLDQVILLESIEYVYLLCRARVGQEALDRAFGVALSKHSKDAMEVLLRSGAVASSHQDLIRERVRVRDAPLVQLLLSAPSAMSVEAWRYCLEPEVDGIQASKEQPAAILHVCIAHRPEVVCGDMLIKALDSQNIQATAIILAYASSGEEFRDIGPRVRELASRVQDDSSRYRVFSMLAKTGFVIDDLVIREELVKDVKSRRLQLVQLFTEAGVTLDAEPHNAVYWAISRMDLEILELFKQGTFSTPVSSSLKFVPNSPSEEDMIQLLEILSPFGLAGEQLNLRLVCAVEKQQVALVAKLLYHGASVEFDQASAIRAALETTDFDVLALLLQSTCSPEILSTTVLTAININPRPSRLRAFKALLEKGVLNQDLGVPLQRIVAEDGDMDYELIRLFLQYRAPVDQEDDDDNNPILATVRRGDLVALEILCSAGPRNDTLSKALPIAFDVVETRGYEVARDMIKLLLEKGVPTGFPFHHTLLAAARRDTQLDIVRLLVKHGADANFAAGASFAVAIEAANTKLLAILCSECAPTRMSLESVLLKAVDPRYYKLQNLEMLLLCAQSCADALNASWSSKKFRGNPHMAEIIPCFLRHGLDVNLENGVLLCFAVQEQNVALLVQILSAKPNTASLTSAFKSANAVEPARDIKLWMMRLLLEAAESAEIGQSAALLKETHVAVTGDLTGLKLLLHHRAIVEFGDGKAVQVAAVAGALEALDLLLLRGPGSLTLRRACLATASAAITPAQKHSVFERLLVPNRGISAEDMSKLLADSVEKLPEFVQLPQLLLARGAEVKLETVKAALTKSSRDLLTILTTGITNPFIILEMFRHTRKIMIDSDRRYWIYQYLLGKGIPSEDVSQALVDSMKASDLGDLSFPKLLLEHGAAVGHDKCAAFALAMKSNSLDAIKLLIQHIVDHDMANVVFDLARKSSSLSTQVRLEVYRRLLQWNIGKSSLYNALLETIKGSSPKTENGPTVKLLIEGGADPNQDTAHCFLVAAKAGASAEFRALSKHAKLPVVTKALLDHFVEEWEVIWWIRACLEEQTREVKIGHDELLFKCLQKFPRGTALLTLLLENGVSLSAKKTHRICPGWKSEPCTVLIWALFSEPRVGNDVILSILARGGQAALPAYSTPVTNVSAIFGCLLSKKRTPVLKALLNLDRDGVLDSMILGSTFVHLAAHPQQVDQESNFLDDANEITPRDAALYLGNFDAFRLMKCGQTPNDGTLHLAALLALPNFVQWLLDKHDANYRAEEFDFMIPLVLACESKPQPWCKAANEESDWITRQKKTIEILVPKTKLNWRYRQKTLLHIALDNGPEITKTMIEALDLRRDPERDEKYLYVDRTGIHYSPDQYVARILEVEKTERQALIECLEQANVKSRYYKAVEPKSDSQPEGYCGLPPRLDKLWKIHEESKVISTYSSPPSPDFSDLE
ncbi:hypothetical protein GGR54DRAFT_638689 [Hypoxylon sp. NC1633]|nr:hypothetical protein GGR54DRAFT_638689 [Hypoxylon sp. NC1633]